MTDGPSWERVRAAAHEHWAGGPVDCFDCHNTQEPIPEPSWWCERCGDEIDDCTCGSRQRPVLS